MPVVSLGAKYLRQFQMSIGQLPGGIKQVFRAFSARFLAASQQKTKHIVRFEIGAVQADCRLRFRFGFRRTPQQEHDDCQIGVIKAGPRIELNRTVELVGGLF